MNRIKEAILRRVYSVIGRISPTALSKILFKKTQHRKLNLKNPQDFNEKLMWLKLNNYNNNPTVWQCADKYQVRKYALKHGLTEKNLPKLLHVYQNANEIDFDKLPKKFALKCSHGCGYNIICRDKSKLDIKKTRKQLNKWLRTKFGYASAEPHYTHVKPVIICEEFIENNDDTFPIDYKIHCFNGKAKIVRVGSERSTGLKLAWYDLNWNKLDYGTVAKTAKKPATKPRCLKEMLKLAEGLSAEFPFVRVDFYEYKGYPILGEMTFTSSACLATYYNEKGLQKLGNMLQLDIK